MHPAEHRALRELRVFGTQLERHWERLARRLAGPEAALLSAGAADARALLAELDEIAAASGVPTRPAAALRARPVPLRRSSRPDRRRRDGAPKAGARPPLPAAAGLGPPPPVEHALDALGILIAVAGRPGAAGRAGG